MAKITNEMRYKTAEERVKAFEDWCIDIRVGGECHACKLGKIASHWVCFAHWLALEADEEKPEPCFYCGNEMHYRVEHRNFTDKHWLECTNNKCNFESPKYESKADAISAHNRVARAVRAAMEGGVK